MFDAEIGLDPGDSITLKFRGGTLFVWNDNGRVSVSVNPGVDDILQVAIDEDTGDVIAVTSPHDRIVVPLKTWLETLREIVERKQR